MPITASFANKSFGGSRILGSTNAYNPQKTSAVDYLLIAGGGGGGSLGAGGGGGGGIVTGVYSVTPGQTLTFAIGGGGGGASVSPGNGNKGGNGGDSTITSPGSPTVTAFGGGGGGRGGTPNTGADRIGQSGGCGGGGGRDHYTFPNYGTATQPGNPPGNPWGRRGGDGAAPPFGGSGGGGGINGEGGNGSNGSNPTGADERGGGGGNGYPIPWLISSYNENYLPPTPKPYPNAPSHDYYAPLGYSSWIAGAGGGGGIQGGGQAGGSGGDTGWRTGYPHAGGDGGNGGSPIRQANSGVIFGGNGGGGGGTGPGDPFRDGGSGSGGAVIIRWSSTEFANATGTTGSAYYHENAGYRHFHFVGSGTITF